MHVNGPIKRSILDRIPQFEVRCQAFAVPIPRHADNRSIDALLCISSLVTISIDDQASPVMSTGLF